MSKKHTIVELFAGAGGMALGSSRAGLKHIMLNEIDKNAVNTLRKNKPRWNVVHASIDDINGNDYMGVDIVSGGFPCQSFSYAGKRRGLEDSRGTLFYSYAKFVEESKPKVFLIENVKGLLSHDEGRTFKHMIEIMEKMGYHIKYKVMNAAFHGVAQKRQRIFIIGFLNKEKYEIFEWPIPFKKMTNISKVLKNMDDNGEGYKYSENKKAVLDLVPPGGYWRDLPDKIAREYMKGSYFLGGGKTGIARRISWDEPSLTLTTSPMQKQTERCHPDETRPFTINEYSRIQSFPDSWIFTGSISSKYRQIGNAVPPILAYKVFKSIVKSLNYNT